MQPGMWYSWQEVQLVSKFLDIRVCVDHILISMEKLGCLGDVMNIGPGGFYRVDQSGVFIHTYVDIHSKAQLHALLCLVQLWISFTSFAFLLNRVQLLR